MTVLAKLFTVENFGMGATNAFFHAEGGLPILSVLFTKLSITQANSTAQCLKIQSVYYQILVQFFNSNQNSKAYIYHIQTQND